MRNLDINMNQTKLIKTSSYFNTTIFFNMIVQEDIMLLVEIFREDIMFLVEIECLTISSLGC